MRVSINDLREIHELGNATREWVVASERIGDRGVEHNRFIGYTEAGPNYRFVRQAPDFAMVLVTESGEGLVWVDGRWKPCTAGHAYITAPRAPHAYHIKPGGRRWRLHWAIYREQSLLPSLGPGVSPRLLQVEATGFRHAVEGFCHEKSSRADPSVLSLWAALIDRAMLRLLDADDGDPRLDRLWLAVREDFGAEWTLGRMARCVGLSEESLRRLCQQHLGHSPMAQCTRLRMQAAADILRHSNAKLESLAARFGYADAFSFSTAFRRVWGVPPSHYRAQSRVDSSVLRSQPSEIEISPGSPR